MRVRDALAGAATDHDTDDDAGREWLDAVYAPPPGAFVRLNMISSPTGAASGADGTSNTLTSPTDRAILGIIRRHSDAVVVGAATIRAEGYVLPRATRLAIVTTTGDLDGHRLDADPGRVLLVCPANRVEAVAVRAALPGAQIVPVGGEDDLEPSAVVEALAARGVVRVVCEGGPTLAARFASAGVIDEYCVTVAPVLEPARQPFLPVDERVDTTVAGMLVDDAGFSYLRLRARRADPAGAASR
ncbi:dihydrofolate reductase family protein [Microbacterium sp. NPDC091313]